jgi:hypothetical protein
VYSMDAQPAVTNYRSTVTTLLKNLPDRPQ